MYHNGVVVLCGANANGHYWRQFVAGEFSQRRLAALSARTGELLWARDANYRHRPVLVGDTVFAEPWAYDVRTGEQRTRRHPVNGVETAWQFLRPGHHCGAISACPQMLLMRSGFTAYYDLNEDSGIRHFAGHRPGCWINAIPSDGLALVPEASAGCVCLFPIVCSLALEPRADHERWSIYSTGGAATPVRHLAVNLGAPGDTRDSDGTLWFGYPRPSLPSDRAAMGFSLDVEVEFLPGGQYVCHRSALDAAAEAGRSWVLTSYARGLKRCVVPLRGDADGSGEYIVWLYFPKLEDQESGSAGFDIKLQGRTVAEAFDPGQCTEPLECAGIRADRDLEIELVPCGNAIASVDCVTVLSGLEVVCVQEPTEKETTQLAQQ